MSRGTMVNGFTALWLPLVLISLVVGCGKQEPSPAPAPPKATTAAPASPAAAATKPPASSPTPAKVTELKLGHWMSTDSSWQRQYEDFANEIQKGTNGQIKINIIPGGALGKPQTHHELVMAGTLDLAAFLPEYFPGSYPLSHMLELPFLNPDPVTHYKVAQQLLKTGQLAKLWYDEVHPLAAGGTAIYHITTAKKKILKPADLKGLKFRKSSGAITPVLENLGVTVIPLTYAEAYSSLQKGVVDGLLYDYATIGELNMQERLKYINDVGAVFTFIALEMNKKLYESFPKDIQKVFDDAADHSVQAFIAAAADYEKRGKDKVIKAGVDIYTPTPAEIKVWRQAFQLAWDKWLAQTGESGKKLLRSYKAEVEKLGGKIDWSY